MIQRLVVLSCLVLLLPSAGQAQDIQQLLQQYQQQLGNRPLPPAALIEQAARRPPIRAHLQELQRSGLLQRQQLDGLERAYRNAPRRTAELVGELHRFSAELQRPDCLRELRSLLGASWRAHRARRLFLLGARNVLDTISRTSGELRELEPQVTPLFEDGRGNLLRYGSLVGGKVEIPLGKLVLQVGEYGTFNVFSRSREPLVMTRTDPIYLTPWHLRNKQPASSWREPICVYHFPEQGWTLIGLAQTAAGRTRRLLATDGQRTLILDRMDQELGRIRATSEPFAMEAARLLARRDGVERLVFRAGRLQPGTVDTRQMRAGPRHAPAYAAYRIGVGLERAVALLFR